MSHDAPPQVVLASASTGRLDVLRAAGIDPQVLVADIDEDAVRAAHVDAAPAEVVAALARAKAEAVVARYGSTWTDTVIIAADSMLLLDGQLQGKPHSRAVARQRWRGQLGRAGDLLTGHAVVRVRDHVMTARAWGTATATVHMGSPTEDELEAYLDSGEPLGVAGAFTIDRLGGWFIDRIEGDPSCVVGLSLPTTRRLLWDVGITVTDLWRTGAVG